MKKEIFGSQGFGILPFLFMADVMEGMYGIEIT